MFTLHCLLLAVQFVTVICNVLLREKLSVRVVCKVCKLNCSMLLDREAFFKK